MGPKRPGLAFALSLAAGILVLLEGALFSWAGAIAPYVNLAGVGVVLSTLGTVALFLGLVLLVLSYDLYANPEHHRWVGIAILVVSVISIIAGGGFLLGVLLGMAGGILALTFDPGAAPAPEPPVPPSGSTCPNCGEKVPAWSSICIFCGAAMPRQVGDGGEGSVPGNPNP
jgi:vacuolar-type H+-ATPase subunit I/STV1